MVHEPTHQDHDLIEQIYWHRNEDPDQVFAALSGSSPELWQRFFENYTDPQTGLSITIPDSVSGLPNPWEHGQTTSLYTEISDPDGNKVGDFGIHVYLRPDHTLGIQLGPADLRQHPDHPEHRDDLRTGQGFISRLVGALEAEAEQTDVNELSVHAVNIGSYAWATMGFDFDPRRHAPDQDDLDLIQQGHSQELGAAMLFHLRELSVEKPELQPVIEELERHLDAGPMQLSELAQWGRPRNQGRPEFQGKSKISTETERILGREHGWTEVGRETWPGKYAIIRAGDWDGVKLL